MAHCNSCGKYISPKENIYKRQLFSGSSSNTYYGKRVTFSTRRNYSMQVVCYDCAMEIDQNAKMSFKLIFQIILILGIIFLLSQIF